MQDEKSVKNLKNDARKPTSASSPASRQNQAAGSETQSSEDIEKISVGRVKDAHGLKGEIYIVISAGEADWIKKLKTVELKHPVTGDVKILTVKSMRGHQTQGNNGILLTSQELSDRNQSELLKGYVMFIPRTLLKSQSGEQPYLIELLNMQVIDQKRGPIGVVSGFSSNGAQDLLVIRGELNGKAGEWEVPFVEAFVVNIDYISRVMNLDLPEGLIGL
jgi:16S rRNA processing protein RimM